MKVDFLRITLNTDRKANAKCPVSNDEPKKSKQFTLKEFILLLIVLLILLYFCGGFNIIIIGNNSSDNNIEINNSRTMAVPLSTDETTTIPEE